MRCPYNRKVEVEYIELRAPFVMHPHVKVGCSACLLFDSAQTPQGTVRQLPTRLHLTTANSQIIPVKDSLLLFVDHDILNLVRDANRR
jgi:hypothetical protein